MSDLATKDELVLFAKSAYAHAEENYGKKGARYDVIVECMSQADIICALAAIGVKTVEGALKWADDVAGLQHEQELNQAWDGPESVRSSELYEPDHEHDAECARIDEQREITSGFDKWEKRLADEAIVAVDPAPEAFPYSDMARRFLLAAAAEDMLAVLRNCLPPNVCLTNSNVPDNTIVPIDVTMGELRAIAAVIAKATGQ